MSLPGRPCPECASPIAIHQPDPGLPDRLLGACLRCRTWCLLDGELVVVAILPTHGLPPGRMRPRQARPRRIRARRAGT